MNAPAAHLAPVVLRLALGVTFMLHGYAKLLGPGQAGAAQFFSSLGYPPETALLAGLGECLGGLALFLGFCTRLAGLLLAAVMMLAVGQVRGSLGFIATEEIGWEFEFLLATAALSLALSGPGMLSLDAWLGRQRTLKKPESG